MSRARIPTVLAAALVAGVLPRPARADGPRATVAETLFREGKRLMGDKRYADACPKLAESQRLDPGGGTLLLLGLCHEAAGKTASAWAELNDAVALAVEDKRPDRKKVAEAHIAALEPKLSRLTIRVPAEVAAIDGLIIEDDGVGLERPAWGVAAPVDPGPHHLDARAPGRVAWSTDVVVGAHADAKQVDVPPLALVPPPKPEPVLVQHPPTPAPAPSKPKVQRDAGPARNRSHRTWALVAGAAGLAGAGVGTWFGISALRKQQDADRRCPGEACPDPGAVELNRQAHTAATVSSVAFAIGAVGIGTSVYLLITDRGEVPRRTGILIGPTGASAITAW